MSEESPPVPPLRLDDGPDRGRSGGPSGRARGGGSDRTRGQRTRGQLRRQPNTAARVAGHPVRQPAGHSTTRAPQPARLTPAVTALAATVLGYALIAGSFRRLTWPAELGTFLAGSLITCLALRRDCQRRPAPQALDRRGVLVWGALLVVFGVWELYADFRGSTPDHPTLSILMGPLLQEPWNRAAGYVLWLATGLWVVRR